MNSKGLLLFDIDGVIRDVTHSYRLAIQETVNNFCKWRPSLQNIDNIKAEGCWNNDWEASLILIKRYNQKNSSQLLLPTFEEVRDVFSKFYFGGDPYGNQDEWTGFIKNENLLVSKDFFQKISQKGFKFGFLSGAETPSAKFLLEKRIGLTAPYLIAMEDAPGKPDPSGLLKLASQLSDNRLGETGSPIAYIGDTVADISTVKNAEKKIPNQKFISIAVAPPHLHSPKKQGDRNSYEMKLKSAGADEIISRTSELINLISKWEK